MAGLSCDMGIIKKICKNNKIKLIEDCAHSVGTKFGSTHAGNLEFLVVFLFIQLNRSRLRGRYVGYK